MFIAKFILNIVDFIRFCLFPTKEEQDYSEKIDKLASEFLSGCRELPTNPNIENPLTKDV